MNIRDYFAPLFRWLWLVILAVAVAIGFSLLVGLRQSPIYRTGATLIIGSAIQNANPNGMDVYLSQQLNTTYAEIAYREPVRLATKQALGLDWLPDYSVQPVPNTQLLEILVTDTDPVRAQAVANELANQLVLQSPTSRPEDQNRQEFINTQLDELEVKISETQNDIDAEQKELANLTSARQIADKQNQINALQNKLDSLQVNYTSLLYNSQQGATNTLSIIEQAPLPTAPIGPNVPLQIITAAIFTFVIAIASAYLIDFFDTSIKTPEEIKKLSGLPMLVGIPYIPGESYPEKLITVNQPRSPTSEAFRSLRTGLQFSMIDRHESTSIMVTSPNPSEGKSLTTANLAIVMAQAGYRILLIDLDLRRPVLHKIFGMDNRIGFTEFLRNLNVQDLDASVDALLGQLTRPTPVEGLFLLSSGPIPPNPSELLGSNTNRMFLTELKKRYDYLIIDTPPAMLVTDSVVLSTVIDGVILVIDAKTTQKNQLKQSSELLKNVDANILGVVVNRLSNKSDGFTSSRYYYYRKYADTLYGYISEPDRNRSNGRGLFTFTRHKTTTSAKEHKQNTKRTP
jgi:succinoglycan biosynthesis transport protein ExoP